jgi:hypothetical protein
MFLPEPDFEEARNLKTFANARNSSSRASIELHSPSTTPHLGQSIRFTNSPLS